MWKEKFRKVVNIDGTYGIENEVMKSRKDMKY